MSCELCDYPLRTKVTFDHPTLHCDECGFSFVHSIIGIYVGMKDYFHMYHCDSPFTYCPNCKMKAKRFYLPCDNAAYFDMNSITIHKESYKD
jgi:hypothetical protein